MSGPPSTFRCHGDRGTRGSASTRTARTVPARCAEHVTGCDRAALDHYSADVLNDASIRIVRDVRAWLSDRNVHDAEWLPDGNAICCLEILLQARVDWLNRPDPTLWRTGDAHRLLVDTAATRLTDAYGLTEHGPAVLRVLVGFLDDTDRFHPASMRVAALRKELDRAAAKFPAAMSDESRWRLAKRVFLAMGSEGVDLHDDDAVDAWAAEFSRAGAARRRSVLGVLLDREPEFLACRFVIRDRTVAAIAAGEPVPPQFRRHDPDTCPDCLDSPANPPIALPPIEELADAARRSALMRALVACGRWAGDGCPVTRRGFPSAADTRSLADALDVVVDGSVRAPDDHLRLSRTWRLALDVEVLRLHRTRVVAGPALADVERATAGYADPEHVLAVWKGIADRAVTGPEDVADDADDGGPVPRKQLAEFSRPWGPRALGELYRSAGPAELDDLVDQLVDEYHGPDAAEVLTMMAGAAVRAGLLAATEAGAVAVTDPTATDHEVDEWLRRSRVVSGEPAWAVVPAPGTTVELTPLGRYLVRLNLLAEGSDAPLLEPVG